MSKRKKREIPILTHEQIRELVRRGAKRADDLAKHIAPSFRLPPESWNLVLR